MNETRIIAQVYSNKSNGQKLINVPKRSHIMVGDWVELTLLPKMEDWLRMRMSIKELDAKCRFENRSIRVARGYHFGYKNDEYYVGQGLKWNLI